MKIRMRCSIIMLGMFISMLHAMPCATYGWGPIAHCALGEGTDTGPGYNNVPDYWASHARWEVGPYFLWSHEYKVTTGRSSEPTLNLRLPGAVDDCPGHYFNILMQKMDSAHVTDSVRKVIRGWRAHNAADQVVHYGYFPFPGLAWWKHEDMERAADMFIYVEILCNNRLNLAFDARGDARGHNFRGGVACGDASTDAFLCLAQKVFRKKQATLDIRNGNMWGLDVQSVTDIRLLRTAMERNL